MINPSTHGWIDKYFLKQNASLLPAEKNPTQFYNKVRETGFIYGHIVSFNTPVSIITKGWLENEISKIFPNEHFGYRKVALLTPKEDEKGNVIKNKNGIFQSRFYTLKINLKKQNHNQLLTLKPNL